MAQQISGPKADELQRTVEERAAKIAQEMADKQPSDRQLEKEREAAQIYKGIH